MAGVLALRAKVFGSFDKSGSEVHLPVAIHRDAGGERVVAADDPAGEVEAIRGPVNPSLNYECGLLVDGFDDTPWFMMTYNKPYYEDTGAAPDWRP